MVLTTYLDSAVESDPFDPTQLDILVCGSRFHTGSSINCLVGGVDGSKRFRSNCCIVAFFCFRASYFRSTFGVF